MRINLVEDVKTTFTPSGKRGYTTAVVIYQVNGSDKREFKIMDFANPKVFALMKDAKAGESYDVEVTKNDKGYNHWATATPVAAGASPTAAVSGTRTAPTSNYETREERAVRQRLIVRQSSLTAALATLSPGSKGPLNPDEVESLADRYAAWVFAQPSVFDEPNDLPPEDIPF